MGPHMMMNRWWMLCLFVKLINTITKILDFGLHALDDSTNCLLDPKALFPSDRASGEKGAYNRGQKYLHNYEKRCCSWSHKQCKTVLKDHMVRFKIMSLYIYKDLRLKTLDLKSNESRDHYHEDGNLVPSPRYGFGFEAAFQLWYLKLNISVS